MILDITEGEIHGKGRKRKIRIVNVYGNRLGEGQTWQGLEQMIRRATQDIPWRSIIKRRALIVGDMNAHSPTMESSLLPYEEKRQTLGSTH